MKTYLLFLCAFLASAPAFAQKEAYNWYFGDHAGITFHENKPVSTYGSLHSFEGCAVMSDRTTGELLFYTNGETVWNRNHQIMSNGTGLLGGQSSTQNALITPDPGNSLRYYIFTVPDLTPSNGQIKTTYLHYSIVSLENPNGVVLSKNTPLLDKMSEKITGTVRNCNSGEFWVVTHHAEKNIFYSFHVTAAGIDMTPVVSPYSEVNIDHRIGYIKISPDGSKLALASLNSYFGNSYLMMFDFDQTTGVISNPRRISDEVGNRYYGVSFSPDNMRLYVSGAILAQYTLYPSDANSIRGSRVILNATNTRGALQMAPDGKIYLASSNEVSYKTLDAIEYPNLSGTNCGYKKDAVELSTTCLWGLPNFMDYNIVSDNVYFITVCSGGNNTDRIGIAPVAGYSYLWTPAEGLSNPVIADPVANPLKDTEYLLKVTAPDGCESFQIYIVKVDTIKPKVAPVSPICAGASVQLSASGGDSYLWSPAEDLDTATKPNPIARPQTNGRDMVVRYTVIVTRGKCSDTAFADIEVNAPFANAGRDTAVCYGSSALLGDIPMPGHTYKWTPDIGLSNRLVSNPIASPNITTRYIIEAALNGCVKYDTVVVTVLPAPKVVVPKDTTICSGSTVQLAASGGSIYSWFPAEGLNNPNIANPIASPSVTTRYRVLTSNGSCIDSAFVTVHVLPYPQAKAGADKTICPGASARIGDTPIADDVYLWQPATGLDNPAIANPVAAPTSTTRYILTVTGAGGCVAFDTVIVTVGNIIAKTDSVSPICKGMSVRLSASGGSEYQWTPTAGLDNPDIADPFATPEITTTYKVVVSSGKCRDSAFVRVEVHPMLTANAGKDAMICPGKSVMIGSPPIAGNVYQWNPSTGLDNPTKANPIATPSVTTQYILSVTNNSCTVKDTVVVTVGSVIIPKVSGDTKICAGKTAQLFASGGNTYLWSPATGLDNPTIPNPLASPDTTTRYKVIVSDGICADSAFVMVVVVGANAGKDVVICRGEVVRLGAPPMAGSTYLWTPATGLSNPFIANPFASPDVTTQYKVVASGEMCIDSAFVTITVMPRPLADAGEDMVICGGETVQIGASSVTDNTYSWTPAAGLNNPSIANPLASPLQTTRYVVTARNSIGCIAKDTVWVKVNPVRERVFALTPTKISFLPGGKIQTTLTIPEGIQVWTVRLVYNPSILAFDALVQTTNGIQVAPTEQNGQLTINGTGGNGEVSFRFTTFLPATSDTNFTVSVVVDTTDAGQCETAVGRGNTLELDQFCGRSFRIVNSTGKSYFLTSNEHNVQFGVGLSGNVRLEVYDYTGALREVSLDTYLAPGEYSVEYELPAGLYFFRLRAGLFDEIGKMIVW